MSQYKIKFSGWNRGCGCGCFENDLNIASQKVNREFDFSGEYNSAKEKLEELKQTYGNYGYNAGRWSLKKISRLVLLSGPSSVGKGPLVASIDNFFKDIQYATVPVIKSKESRLNRPRPDEVHLWNNPQYFMTSNEIRELAKDSKRYLIGDCRGYPQAIDLDLISNLSNDLTLIEAYHTLGAQLRSRCSIEDDTFDKISLFISPISGDEIRHLKYKKVDIEQEIRNIMKDKLDRRSKFQGLNPRDPQIQEDNISRARDAYLELQNAHKYISILINHCGEGHPNWNRLPNGKFTAKPIDEAWEIVESFAKILAKGNSRNLELWNKNTI